MEVIGVVKDFNYKSLYDKVEPAILQIYPQAAWKVAVKLSTNNMNATLAQIDNEIARPCGYWDQATPFKLGEGAPFGKHGPVGGWIVERTLAWISRNRRLARDFERYARSAAAFIRLAMIRIMLRRLTKPTHCS